MTFHAGRNAEAAAAKAQPLAGIWSVEEQEQSSRVLPPLLTDTNRWRYLIVQPGGVAIVRPMSGSDHRYRLDLNETNRSLILQPVQLERPGTAPMFARNRPDTNAPPVGTFAFRQEQPGRLTLEGTYAGESLRATLQRLDESSFPLTLRRTNWLAGPVDQQ